ncbi:hypothetical protein [Paenibacillus lignilyticus]|uniref:Uncharacterized protein n=1 Tax=Paenibacillus lignilyticus TaxID=1172615 RepID=A0ABS5CGN1_9BACL|nr:hypothetical protein [Paenibacillus lignilyticus]MBP3965038.1 hypothetical protein [Paenibacillus lignilyticus]
MKKWQIIAIGITTAAVIMGGVTYAGFSYLGGILKPTVAAAEQTATAPAATPIVLPNKYTLNNFEFDFRRYNSINGQMVLYNGEMTSVALLPQADRTKAINSALSTPAEVAKALGYIHAKFNETLASYNQGSYDTLSYIQETDGTLTIAPNYLFDERLTHQPEVYLRMADVIGNEKAAKYLCNAAALVEIAVKNEDIQAILYAHRIIHNVDSFIINRPSEGEEPYSAAKIAEGVAYIEKQ